MAASISAKGSAHLATDKQGKVLKVSGPLVVAEQMKGAQMYELVKVGEKRIVGEIIELEGNTASIQCYENTSGLRLGDAVVRTEKPLSVLLGPGLMGEIFDGIQRPLETIYDQVKKADGQKEAAFIPLGVEVENLNPEKKWRFTPRGFFHPAQLARGAASGAGSDEAASGAGAAAGGGGGDEGAAAVGDGGFWVQGRGNEIKVGDSLSAGDVIGVVWENSLFNRHAIMVPPHIHGNVTYVGPLMSPGEGKNHTMATIHDVMVKVRKPGRKREHAIKLAHFWPVRKPRKVSKKLKGEEALITGQRVIDILFPSVLGGTCAIPGAFGCGKTCISQALSKHSNTSAIVYVGCGERGNEMAEVLHDFPELKLTTDSGEEVSIMDRTCLVANTSNMPVAAREASIYTGITIAEYLRDQGFHVAMMADSTSRWAEALREISGRLGEMPADGGYPAYLSARLAAFYERAGKVECLGSPKRQGSVTVVGAVSPPGGDFSDPVTSATLNIVQVFWGLDKKLAQRKHFPSLNWNVSYSKYKEPIDKFLNEFTKPEGDYSRLRDQCAQILQQEKKLLDIVQLVGEEQLQPSEKVDMEVAKMIREEFLQQDAFSKNDYNCPLEKSIGMLRCIIRLYDRCIRAVRESGAEAHESGDSSRAFTWQTLRAGYGDLLQTMYRMHELEPTLPADRIEASYKAVMEEIDKVFEEISQVWKS